MIKNRQSIRGACPGDLTEADFYLCGQHIGFTGVKKIAVAHDPRPSSFALYQAFISGCLSQSVTVETLGCAPTPVLNFYRHHQSLECGVVITASHNPVTDNGIKLFSEKPMNKIQLSKLKKLPSQTKGIVTDVKEYALSIYVQALDRKFPNINRKKCLIDIANGSCDSIKFIINRFIDATYINSGCPEKINENAGIFTPEMYQKVAQNYDAVLLIDGDGDRLNMLDSNGALLDGDDFLYQFFSQHPSDLVGTIMTNSVLEELVIGHGYQFYRTGVGDDLVMNKLNTLDLRYGGEQCGHVIDTDWLDSTDPVYLSLLLLSYDQLHSLPNKYPQHHINLMGYRSIAHLESIIAPYPIRSIIRHSNTEKVTRIMLEGTPESIQNCSKAINHQIHVASES